MDSLKKKYLDYMRLENCKVIYELENDSTIEFLYREENFAHMLGLHKLKDIQLIQFWLDKTNRIVKLETVLSRIRNESFTESMIKSSVFYPDIQERYNNFSYENLTTLSYTDAVINFNPEIIKSKIKSDYLLFEKKSGYQYNHMGIALDEKTGNRYIETFFHEATNKYLAGQTVVKVKGFSLYDANGEIIVTDSFM